MTISPLNWHKKIVDARDLTFQEKGMAFYLSTFMNDSNNAAWPCIGRICGEMMVARASACKYLAGLETKGWISKQRRFGKTTIYRVLDPDEAVDNCPNPPVDNPVHNPVDNHSSSKSVLVQDLNHSSSNLVPPVVQNLNCNRQMNSQKNKDKDMCAPERTDTPVKKKRFSPPTADDVRAYCQTRSNEVDPERFVDFYTSKGWKVGKQPMKDWQAAVRTWERGSKGEKKSSAGRFMENLRNA